MASVNYYGLDHEKYKEFFLTKTKQTAELMQAMDTELAKVGINSRELTCEVLWNVFESICSSTDEDARQYLLETDPQFLEKRDSVYTYTRNTEIKESLDTLTAAVTDLQASVAELVPPPAALDGFDDAALESEYCQTCEASSGACELL